MDYRATLAKTNVVFARSLRRGNPVWFDRLKIKIIWTRFKINREKEKGFPGEQTCKREIPCWGGLRPRGWYRESGPTQLRFCCPYVQVAHRCPVTAVRNDDPSWANPFWLEFLFSLSQASVFIVEDFAKYATQLLSCSNGSIEISFDGGHFSRQIVEVGTLGISVNRV